jgi:hypothetical protein
VLAACGLWLLFSPKHPRHPSGTATAQCACGFGVKVPRGQEKICATRWSPIFLCATNDCYHARFPPKPGHIALSPHRSGCLFGCYGFAENRGSGLSWLRGLAVFFISVQAKPKIPQTESVCGSQEVFVKFIYRNARHIPQVLRYILRLGITQTPHAASRNLS